MPTIPTSTSCLQARIIDPTLVAMTHAIATAHEDEATALVEYLLASKLQLARMAHSSGSLVVRVIRHV
jgi:hypothetical protein